MIIRIMRFSFIRHTPLYNTENGLYRELTKKLGYMTLSSDANEGFYGYGLDKQNSKVLFCTTKQPLPNIFQCTAFKKHSAFLMSQNHENLEFLKMFMFYHRPWIVKRTFSNTTIMLIYIQLTSVMNNSRFWIITWLEIQMLICLKEETSTQNLDFLGLIILI